MKNLSYNKRSVEKLSLRNAVYNSSNATVTYSDEGGNPKSVSIANIFGRFDDYPINIAISLNTDEDLLENGELPTNDD